jgi:stage II sporulation protein M
MKKNKKTLNKFLKEQVSFILESKKFILFSVVLFLFCFVLGLLIFPSPEILQVIKNLVEELLKQTEGMSFFQLFWFIFSNNLKVSFISMIFGIFFCIVPFLILVSNGYFVGFISSQVVSQEGIFSLWRLIPHGIFELTGVFISVGLGFRLGLFLFEKREKKFSSILSKSFISFLVIVLPLLVVAALIESALIILGI